MVRERWLVFAILFAARTTIAYQFQSLVSVGPLLVDMLAIDFATLGALVGCYMLPGVVLALPGGILDQIFGAKRTISLGLVLMTAGVVVMAYGSGALLFGGRLLSGAGAAMLNVVLARTIGAWFPDEDLPAIMGSFVASWPLGMALSLLSVPSLTAAFGWPALMAAAALPSFVCLLIFSTFYNEPPRSRPSHSELRLQLSGREFLRVGVAGAIWGLYNVSYVVFVAALPEFFVMKGYGFTEAAAVSSVLGWVMIVTLPVGGYLSQQFRRAHLAIALCFLIIAASALCLALTPATYMSLAILASALGLPAGLIMALPTQVLAPESRPSGMGVFFTMFYLGMATLPGLAGLIRQHSGMVAAPLLFGAFTITVATAGVILLSWTSRKHAASPA